MTTAPSNLGVLNQTATLSSRSRGEPGTTGGVKGLLRRLNRERCLLSARRRAGGAVFNMPVEAPMQVSSSVLLSWPSTHRDPSGWAGAFHQSANPDSGRARTPKSDSLVATRRPGSLGTPRTTAPAGRTIAARAFQNLQSAPAAMADPGHRDQADHDDRGDQLVRHEASPFDHHEYQGNPVSIRNCTTDFAISFMRVPRFVISIRPALPAILFTGRRLSSKRSVRERVATHSQPAQRVHVDNSADGCVDG